MVESGQLVDLTVLLLLFCAAGAVAGVLSMGLLMPQKLKRKSIQSQDDLHNTLNATPAMESLQPKMYKLTTSPRLDMTKAGTSSSTVCSVNGRICKSYVPIVTNKKPSWKKRINDY